MDQFLPQFRPDESPAVVPQFFMHEGVECVRVLKGGDSRNTPVFRAEDVWERGEFGSDVTYAERWAEQYAQFKAGSQQTAGGTPLEAAPFLNPSRIDDLRKLKVFSLEGLANFDDRHISRLGGHGYQLKEMAQKFLEERAFSDVTALAARNQELEARLAALETSLGGNSQEPDVYQHLSDEQIKERIFDLQGSRPRGNPARATLVSMLRTLEEANSAAA